MSFYDVLRWLAGKKTYALALLFTLYAGFGYFTGQMDANTALQMIMTSGLGATLRNAVGHKHSGRMHDCPDDGEDH